MEELPTVRVMEELSTLRVITLFMEEPPALRVTLFVEEVPALRVKCVVYRKSLLFLPVLNYHPSITLRATWSLLHKCVFFDFRADSYLETFPER